MKERCRCTHDYDAHLEGGAKNLSCRQCGCRGYKAYSQTRQGRQISCVLGPETYRALHQFAADLERDTGQVRFASDAIRELLAASLIRMGYLEESK